MGGGGQFSGSAPVKFYFFYRLISRLKKYLDDRRRHQTNPKGTQSIVAMCPTSQLRKQWLKQGRAQRELSDTWGTLHSPAALHSACASFTRASCCQPFQVSFRCFQVSSGVFRCFQVSFRCCRSLCSSVISISGAHTPFRFL